jgi:hypothetical protein
MGSSSITPARRRPRRCRRLLRCDELQGYLFSRPVSETEIVNLFVPPKGNNVSEAGMDAANVAPTDAGAGAISKAGR